MVGYNSRLKPSEIRFIQESIAGRFQDGKNVNDAVTNILIGETSPEDFPPIKVVNKNGKWYSFDNRRLYVFRVCEYNGIIRDIPVRVMPLSYLREDKFTTENDGIKIILRQGPTLDHYSEKWFRRIDDRGYQNIPAANTQFYNDRSREMQDDVRTISSAVSNRTSSTPSLNTEPTLFPSVTQATPKLPSSNVINGRSTSDRKVAQEEYLSDSALNFLPSLHIEPTYLSSETPGTSKSPSQTVVNRMTTDDRNLPQKNYATNSVLNSLKSHKQYEPLENFPSWDSNARQSVKRSSSRLKVANGIDNPCYPGIQSTVQDRVSVTSRQSVAQDQFLVNSKLSSSEPSKQNKDEKDSSSLNAKMRRSVRKSSSRHKVTSRRSSGIDNPCLSNKQKDLPYLKDDHSESRRSRKERSVISQNDVRAEVSQSHEEPSTQKKSIFRRLFQRICCCCCDNE